MNNCDNFYIIDYEGNYIESCFERHFEFSISFSQMFEKFVF